MWTYVMRQVVMIWKTNAIQARKEEIKLPIRVHIARKPVNSETTAKNKAMMKKGKVNREVKK